MASVSGGGENGGSAVSEFGALVAHHRKLRRMSQERLAELAGLSNAYISYLESGKRGTRPSRDTALGLAQALGAPAVDFLRAANRLLPGDMDGAQGRPTFAEFVGTDPYLKSEQKRILIDTYDAFVGKSASSRN